MTCHAKNRWELLRNGASDWCFITLLYMARSDLWVQCAEAGGWFCVESQLRAVISRIPGWTRENPKEPIGFLHGGLLQVTEI